MRPLVQPPATFLSLLSPFVLVHRARLKVEIDTGVLLWTMQGGGEQCAPKLRRGEQGAETNVEAEGEVEVLKALGSRSLEEVVENAL